MFTLQTLPACDPDEFADTGGKVSGFFLHAGLAARTDKRKNLGRLCRYISHPAVSEKPFSLTSGGNLRHQLKEPDATTQALVGLTLAQTYSPSPRAASR